MSFTKPVSILFGFGCLTLNAQQPAVERPSAPVFVRSYQAPYVSPVQLKNPDRLANLIRAGRLYLTVQDAIALAIENNLDLQVDRYGPLSAEWAVERAQAGGALKGVTSGNSFVNQVTSGQGVSGALLSAGLLTNTNVNSSNGNAVISQIGPITQNLDAVFQNSSAWSHTTAPQPNAVISETTALVDSIHRFNSFVQQGFLSGGYVQVAANESYLKENAPSDVINPSVAPVVQIYLRHNFLSGFGTNVNSRFIRVAQKNVTAANETFRSQLLNLVANVLNLYWDLVTYNDELKARQHNREIAAKFYDDTKQEIRLGEVAGVEIYRAEAELSTRQRELAISEAAVRQQEDLLKNVLSRNGIEDPLVDSAEVVPLDHMEVPAQDDLPPLRELLARALAKRPDIALTKIGDETAEISALGTANGLLPTLQGIAAAGASGTAGTPNYRAGVPLPGYIGGLGTALGEVFRHDYANQRGAVLFQGVMENHIAQGDYGVEQLQLRQGDLVERRNLNQVVVDISNQMVALRQARARYTTAVDTRALQEQLLEKEQQSFALGGSNLNAIVEAERSLAAAQSIEVSALSIYSHARVSLDQVLGETLEVNHISVDEALKWRVGSDSKLPEQR